MPHIPDIIASRSDPVSLERLGRLSVGVARRTVIPYVGAGMTLFAGYPSWSQLCEEVKANAPAQPESPMAASSLTFAEMLERYSVGDWLDDFIRARFAPRSASPELATAPVATLPLLRSPFVVTTNYDNVLERVFAESLEDVYTGNNIDPNTYRQLFSVAREDGSPILLKLHGSFDLRRGLVATYRQYLEAYDEPGRNRQLLAHLMTARSLLFLGCSLDAQDAPTRILADLKSRLGDFAQEHFAIRSQPADGAAEETRLYALGIRPIWYRGPHDEFLQYALAFLSQTAKSATSLATTVPISDANLAKEPLWILQWLVSSVPTTGSVSAAAWKSFATRVKAKKLFGDLRVALTATRDTLEVSSDAGDLVERGRKRATMSMVHPSLPVVYRLPEHAFAKERIRVLELSYDILRTALRVTVNSEPIAECRIVSSSE